MQLVKLNLIPGAVLPVVNVSQYDVKRTFALAVYDGAASYDLTGKTVTIRGTKPDNHGFDYGTSDGVVSFSGNTVTIYTTQQMTAVGGHVMAELRIESGTTVIGTLNFIIDVEPSALSDDTIISDTEIPVIERDFEAALAEAEADALVAEGYAKGTQDGVPVGSGSPYYHDNAKHYKEEAENAASGVLAKYPKIVADYWYVWDVETNQYVNTGVRAKGTQGDPGEGVPAGGTTGQVLRKKSDDNYDTEWANGGGGASALDDLTDVNITTPTSGDGLLYDGAEWVNGDVVVPDELTDELRDAEVIEGKNLWKPAPTLATTTSANVTYTPTYDTNGLISYLHMQGTANARSSIFYTTYETDMRLSAGTYYMSLPSSLAGVNIKYNDSGTETLIATVTPSNPSFTIASAAANKPLQIEIVISSGTAVSDTKLYPMISTSPWSSAGEYEPYYIPVKDAMLPRSEQRVLGAKNLIPYPYTDTTKTVTPITFTDDGDGTITVSSSSAITSWTSFNITARYGLLTGTRLFLKNGTYILTGGVSSRVLISAKYTKNGVAANYGDDVGNGAIFTVSGDDSSTEGAYVGLYLYATNGNAISATKVKPMIRLASDPDDTYVPYAMTNRELTECNYKTPINLTSSDNLNNIVGDLSKCGYYFWKGSYPQNTPENRTYCTMILLYSGGAWKQIVFYGGGIMYTRDYGGSPLAWSSWYKYVGTVVS